MKNKLLVLNMKMYMEISDIKHYINNIKIDSDSIIICPTAIYLPYFVEKYKNVAIQNIYAKDSGAYTGAISAKQVHGIGANYAVIGHSECRKHFNEDDTLINKKIKSALDNELKVILCIGDTREEKDSSTSLIALKNQLDNDLKGIKTDNIIIAYEPIYSIGTGDVPEENVIKRTVQFIKDTLKDKGMHLPVIYGGSVSSKNIMELVKIDNVDGFMVGKASCDIDEVRYMVEVVK